MTNERHSYPVPALWYTDVNVTGASLKFHPHFQEWSVNSAHQNPLTILSNNIKLLDSSGLE